MTYKGGCHCGSVRFEVDAPEVIKCQECNCSICSKAGYLHLIVPRSKFHLFCKTCGVKSFYVPRSNADGYNINVRCLDTQPREVIIEPFELLDAARRAVIACYTHHVLHLCGPAFFFSQ